MNEPTASASNTQMYVNVSVSGTQRLIDKLHSIAATLDDLNVLEREYRRALAQVLGADPCWACGQRGPGLTRLPDGRRVHRWPCLERLL